MKSVPNKKKNKKNRMSNDMGSVHMIPKEIK